MKTKPLSFLLALIFLFLFSGSVFANDYQDYQDGSYAHNRGDYKTAYELWLPLAEQGHDGAQYHLGLMYEYGNGVPQDDKEAVKWYRLAAEQGFAYAHLVLGEMYFQGQGVPQDYVSAHMWINLAASKGHGEAIEMLNMVEKKMTPQQIEKAQEMARNWKPKIRRYRLSAEQGDADAQHNLGLRYKFGSGVTKDYKEAVKWFQLAAKQGFRYAQNNLGVMYLKGQGVSQDYVSAHMWFNLSSSNGNEDAIKYKKMAEKKMTKQQIEKAQEMARNWKPKK